MNKYKTVIITDDTNYVAGKESNGGCYSFTSYYVWDNTGGAYEVQYRTSADFQYCTGCGRFSDCNCIHARITEDKLDEIIKQKKEKNDERVIVSIIYQNEDEAELIELQQNIEAALWHISFNSKRKAIEKCREVLELLKNN